MSRIWVRVLRALSLIFSFIILASLLSGTETSLVADLPEASSRILRSAEAGANFIVINATGFVPATMTIEVGEAVTWHNATATTHTLQSGLPGSQPGAIYLPFVSKQSGNQAINSGPISLPTAPYLTGGEDFTVSLLPDEGFTHTFVLTGTHPYHLATAPQFTGQIIVTEKLPTTLERTSPATGESGVAVTRETIIEFNRSLAEGDVPAGAISAQFGGQGLPARLHLSPDRRRVTLFYDNPLPASARVRVTINSDLLADAEGNLVDADGDGLPGGAGLVDFDTLSLSRIPNTDAWGYVYDSYNKNPGGSDRPVIGATIRVDGFPEANAVTDANGYFLLEDMPAPVFFVHIDGSTASNAPPGTQYATVGKAFHSIPGQSSQLVMDGETFNIYLPPMDLGDLQALSTTEETEVVFGPAGRAELVELFPGVNPAVWDQTLVMVPPNSAMDDAGNPAGQAAIIPVPSDRLPAPLSPFMNHQLDIAVIAPGASNFDEPAPACFPNLPDPVTGQPLPPGAKSALTSFNHDTGQWEIVGPMTVSTDGLMVCTDPGVGIRAPGWHGTQPGSCGGGPDGPPPKEEDPSLCKPILENASKWRYLCQFGGGAGAGSCLILYPAATATCLKLPKFIARLICRSIVNKSAREWIEEPISTGEKCLELLDNCIRCGTITCRISQRQANDNGTSLRSTLSDETEVLLQEYEALGNALRLDLVVHLELQKPIDDIIGDRDIADLTDAELAQIEPLLTPLMDFLDGKSVDEFYGPRTKRLDVLSGLLGAELNLFSSAQAYYSLEDLATGLIQRGRTNPGGAMSNIVLSPMTDYRLRRLFPDTLTFSETVFQSSSAGRETEIPRGYWAQDTSTDTDSDGLTDLRETVVGTSATAADTDGDGIPDGAEVQQGTDPLDGLPVATGIIAGADTPGTAVDVCATNDLAAVADSTGGVSVFDISDSFSPVIIAQVQTPGSAQAVACAGDLVAVATGATGLAVIDLSDPPAAQIVHQLNLNGIVNRVTAAGNLAYVGMSTGQVILIDLVSGITLNQAVMAGAIQDIALAGDYLYALTQNRLYALDLELNLLGSAHTPSDFLSNRHLFVGGGLAYTVHASGYNTFSLANPAQPLLIAAGNTMQRGWRQLVANGSGLGVAAVAVAPSGAGDVNLYDVSDPAQTNAFLTTFETPGAAQAVAIHNGLAYIADGLSGLQVINYLAYDSQGLPPAISLETNFSAGLAEEGQLMRATAVVSDDVQVRNVEFYLDGARFETDGSFPFEFRFTTPLLSQQPGFTLQARAIDTGGNTTWTEVLTFTLAPDATPPQVRLRSPGDGSTVAAGSVSAVSAIFSEPIDPTTLTATAFQLFAAGSDGAPGTGDDIPVSGALTYLEESNATLLTFAAPLPIDRYRAVLSPTVADLAGNPLAAEVAWTFQVKEPVLWINDADGFWDVGANWSTGGAPQADDVVIIDRPAGDFTITIRQGIQTIYSLMSAEAISLSGGSLTFNGASTISNAFALGGGTLTNNDLLTVANLMRWTGGTLNGSGQTIAGGGLEIDGASTKTLNAGILINAGTGLWQAGSLAGTGVMDNLETLRIEGDPVKTMSLSTVNNAGTVVLTGTVGINGGGTTFNNLAGGLFDFQSDADFNWSFSPRHIFNNFGTVRKSGGAGISAIGLTFNGGTIEVLAGTLSLGASGTTISGGAFTVESGAVLDLTGNSGQTYAGVYTGSGGGTIRLQSNTLTIGPGGATFNFPGEMFQWTGGVLAGSDPLTNMGTMVLDGPAAKTLNVTTFNNPGTVILRGTTGINGGGTTFNNLAGGLFDFQSDAAFDWSFSPRHIINNAGIFRKSGGVGTSAIDVTFSGGNVEVLTGTLSLSAGNTTTTGGNFTVASGAVLDLTGGSSHTYIGNYTSTGDGTIRLNSGNLIIGPEGATFDFAGQMFQWTDGDLSGSGTLTNTYTLTVDGDAPHDLTATLNNAGTVIVRGTSGIRTGNGHIFNNLAGALFEVQGIGPYDWGFGGRPIFNNAGSLVKAAPPGTGVFPGVMPFEANLTNTGLIDVQIGTLSLDWIGASSGVINIATDQTLDINNTFENQAGGVIQGSGTLDISDATFTNNGTIAPTVIIVP